MMHTRPIAKLTIDNPDADGRIEKHGYGYDWRFSARRQFDVASTPDREFAPTWYLEDCEIIGALNAVAPRGHASKAHMSLSDWSVEAGTDYWRIERPQGNPAVNWLAYTDARANQYGIVLSQAVYKPRLAVWLRRFAPPPDQTYPVFVEITLHGTTVAYSIQLPLHDEVYKYPRLWRNVKTSSGVVYGCIPEIAGSGAGYYGYGQGMDWDGESYTYPYEYGYGYGYEPYVAENAVYVGPGLIWAGGEDHAGDAYVYFQDYDDPGTYVIYFASNPGGWTKAVDTGERPEGGYPVATVQWDGTALTGLVEQDSNPDNLVDEWERADAAALGTLDGVTHQTLWIEETDGLLMIRADGVAEPWVYDPGDDALAPQDGHVSITVRGHSCMANVQPIVYPTGTATPQAYATVPDWMQQDVVSYLGVSRGEGTKQVEDDYGGPGLHRPVITLGPPVGDEHSRPILYLCHQIHEPVFSAARSSPTETQGRKELVELTWTRRWPRDWRMTATLRDPEDYWLARAVKNAKVTVQAGWDNTLQQIGVFYLTDSPRTWEAGDETRYAEVTGVDYIMARLADRKYLAWSCNPEHWYLSQWVAWRLRCAGVPTALQDITSDDYMVEKRDRKSCEWDFRQDDLLLPALDDLLRSHGWELGITHEGKIRAGARPSYGGTPDFVLDDATQTGDTVIERIEVGVDGDAFRNYSTVFRHEDGLESATWADTDSHKTPGDSQFIGDDWWDVRVETDLADLAVRAEEMIRKRLARSHLVRWTTVGQPQLRPGMFVRVDVDHLGVAKGTVFMIVEDRAELDGDALSFRHSFVGELVESES